MEKNIEVEVRGILNNEEEYNKLLNFLDKNGTNKEIDDRNTVFFIIPNKTLKVSQQISKNVTKIALKLGDIVKDSSQREYELFFSLDQYDTAINIFKHLGFNNIQYTIQKRVNYEYKGASFAVKWSEDWGYHFEIEKVISDEREVNFTRKSLTALAQELKLTLMDEKEFEKRCKEIDARHAAYINKQN